MMTTLKKDEGFANKAGRQTMRTHIVSMVFHAKAQKADDQTAQIGCVVII